MTITPTKDLDLISPFPSRERHRLWGWAHCYTTLRGLPAEPSQLSISCDAGTFGMIDRDNLTAMSHEFPMVGAVTVDASGLLEFTCTRKAFRNGMAKQAVLAVSDLHPSSHIEVRASNIPVIRMLRSAGFRRAAASTPHLLVLTRSK